jgi:hypothetical protein
MGWKGPDPLFGTGTGYARETTRWAQLFPSLQGGFYTAAFRS